MANKRQKKKQQKKNLQRQVQSSGLSEKQVKRLNEEQLRQIVAEQEKKRKERERRNKQARLRYEKNKDLIKSYGLQNKGVTPREPKKIQEFIDRLKPTQKKKRQWFIDNNIEFEYDDLFQTWDEIYQNNKVVYTSDWYLYAGYYDKQGEIGILQHQGYYDTMTVKELKDNIEYALNYKGIATSSGRSGDTIIFEFHKSDYTFMMYQIAHNERRSYQSIVSNEFTLHGILKLTLALLDLSREDLKKHIYRTIKEYLKAHIPELYKQWR